MKSQMNLTLFIGDVLVGVVVLVIGLILAWGILNSTANACLMAAGIGSDVNSLLQSEFASQGGVSFYYHGPPMCRVSSNPLLKCSPTKGWNPNITSIIISVKHEPITNIKIGDVETPISFGLDSEIPVYQYASIDVVWVERGKSYSSTINIPGMYTYQPDEGPYAVGYNKNLNSLLISKTQSVFGDTYGGVNLLDPLPGLSNALLNINESCSDDNKNPNEIKEYEIPAGYQIAINDTHLCLYKLIISPFNDLENHNILFESLFNNKYNGNETKFAKLGYPYSLITNSTDVKNNIDVSGVDKANNTIFIMKDGRDYWLVNASVYSNGELGTCDELHRKSGRLNVYSDFFNENTGWVCDGYFNKVNLNDVLYDPYDQSNVHKYLVGWLKLRCIDLGKHLEYTYKIKDNIPSIKGSDGMTHVLYNFKNYNTLVNWEFNVSYDCDNKKTSLELVGVK